MRKVTFLFALLFIVYTQSSASRFMGGEITAQHIGGNDYAVTLSIYSDTLGTSATAIDVSDINGNHLFQIKCNYDSKLSVRHVQFGMGVYVFSDTITLPGPGTYSLSFMECCRNSSIRNMITSGNESMFLKTILTVDTVTNSTPVFLSPPVFVVQQNSHWTYNPLAYDPDGDSLYCSLTIPLNKESISVTGYSNPTSDSINIFSMDPLTGTISWTPRIPGNFVTCILVEEFRRGKKIGEIRRDMQMKVVADTSLIPKITNLNSIPLKLHGYPYAIVSADQNFSLTLYAIDPNQQEAIHVSVYGEPFLLSENVANCSTSYFKKDNSQLTINFNWKPVNSMVRDKPYLIVFRVSNKFFSYDYTMLLKVNEAAGIAQNNVFTIGDIYPNPVNSIVFLPISLEKETKMSIRILDILGNPVWTMPEGYYDVGKHLLSGEVSLPNGQYIAQILKNDAVCKTQKIVVVK